MSYTFISEDGLNYNVNYTKCFAKHLFHSIVKCFSCLFMIHRHTYRDMSLFSETLNYIINFILIYVYATLFFIYQIYINI